MSVDFVAIDFETANGKRSSACSVGIAIFENGDVVDSFDRLIKPEPLQFGTFNTMINGITANDVCNSPPFIEVWDEVESIIADKTLVAHNASFDMSVLTSCLDCARQEYPTHEYLCTMELATALYPNTGCYRLDYLCAKHSISLMHHKAEQDAIACGKLFMQMLNNNSIHTIDELKARKSIRLGKLTPRRCTSCYSLNYSNNSKIAVPDNDEVEVLYLDDDFVDKNFVFTGTLSSMSRDIAKKLVCAAGGAVQDGITKETHYLVCGVQNEAVVKNGLSTKQAKAIKYAEKGQNIQLIREDDFMKMVDAELWEKFVESL